jgi:hypothetical protein
MGKTIIKTHQISQFFRAKNQYDLGIPRVL